MPSLTQSLASHALYMLHVICPVLLHSQPMSCVCVCVQVYREVAVFDAMNPGGGYSNRVQQLGNFAGSQASTFSEDINDPLYGNSGGGQERVALLAAVHQLRTACTALLQKLMHLQARYNLSSVVLTDDTDVLSISPDCMSTA